jgi:Protein of unknown function (DUF4236)
MGFRVNRRIRIAKGLTLNLSKSGISTSAKIGRVTVNSRRGTTVHVAKGVSYKVPVASTRARKNGATPRPAADVPAGPRYVRRPWGLAGGLFWTLGIFAVLLLGAIPAVGPLFALAVIVALIVVWNVTPRKLRGAAEESADGPDSGISA